ncbi:MAG: hypothetical protein F6K31_19715 [Symploca sp. SIO2G7]|nr:hypothetical protein [Symploca sp. SIO2G7]
MEETILFPVACCLVSEEPPTSGAPPPTKERNFCQILFPPSFLPFSSVACCQMSCCLVSEEQLSSGCQILGEPVLKLKFNL